MVLENQIYFKVYYLFLDLMQAGSGRANSVNWSTTLVNNQQNKEGQFK